MTMPYSFASKPEDYFDLGHTSHAAIFEGCQHVWQGIGKIANYLSGILRSENLGILTNPQSTFVGDGVFIGKGTVVQPGATILGPAWIGENAVIGSNCFIRENVVLGDGAIAGNASEFKNCLILDNAEVPHFNYVGDSILGFHAHLAAGVILSNFRLDHARVNIPDPDNPGGKIDSGLEKMGAIVGDRVEIGCNAVISPGSLLGPRSILYPGTHWRGVLAPDRIVKVRQTQQVIERLSVSKD